MRRLFRASLDDLDMCLEEEWVDSMASFARSLPLQDLKDTMSGNLARKANTFNEADQLLDEIASMINSNTQVKMEVGTAQRWCVSTHSEMVRIYPLAMGTSRDDDSMFMEICLYLRVHVMGVSRLLTGHGLSVLA